MKPCIYVPNSSLEAAKALRAARTTNLATLQKPSFVSAWSAIAYLLPGLHPDGYEDTESGWPRVLRRFAAEAWRRAKAGDLNEDELYPGEAQWSGVYDRMRVHLPDEMERRHTLASNYGRLPSP